MTEARRFDHRQCTSLVLEHAPHAAVVSNLGVASWVLHSVADRDRNYYMRGAMGGTTPTAWGVAFGTDQPVVSLDGDGSLLMAMGCLSTVARYGPENLIVIVLDNDGYETTGGQQSSGSHVNFSGVAANCGLTSYRAHTADEFEDKFLNALEFAGPVLIETFVEHSEAFPPPNYDYGHSLITNRFRNALHENLG